MPTVAKRGTGLGNGVLAGNGVRRSLARFAWLSIGAAVLTIVLKSLAYWLTGSVGLLSDALESLVNLAAAVMGLVVIVIAERPPDEEHAYGHTKVEYFSSGLEGGMILLAAGLILGSAWGRLWDPQALEQVGLGVAISVVAALVNLAVAFVLRRAGRDYRSLPLAAGAKHLLTDVLTTVGVLIGVVLVGLSGWLILDPILAILVGLNILWTGGRLVSQSARGLMDTGLPVEDLRTIEGVLAPYRARGIDFHALRTRQAGMRRFVSLHVLAPGEWSIKRGHDLVEQIDADLRKALEGAVVFTHLEPLDDPAAMKDVRLDRE